MTDDDVDEAIESGKLFDATQGVSEYSTGSQCGYLS